MTEVWDASQFPNIVCKYSGGNEWEPQLYSEIDYQTRITLNKSRTLIKVINSAKLINECEGGTSVLTTKNIYGQSGKIFKILSDGSAVKKIGKREWKRLQPDSFCIDGIQNISGDLSFYSGNEHDALILWCPSFGVWNNETELTQKKVSTSVHVTINGLSSIALLITIIVHVLLWDRQKVNAWCVLCHFSSLFVYYFFLFVCHISSFLLIRDGDDPGIWNTCGIIGMIIHFFSLSSFTWLSVICLDVWRTFRILRPPSICTENRLKRFLFYSIFGFGIPAFVVGTGIILEQLYGEDPESTIITPGYGRTSCYLEINHALLPYFYIPVSLLLGGNILLFSMTIYSLNSIQKSTELATSSSSKLRKDNPMVSLFIKLFLIMGLPWVLEVVCWSIGKTFYPSPWYLVVSDVIISCQSFALMAVFAFKKETCDSLKQKYPKFKREKESEHHASATITSTVIAESLGETHV